MGSYLYLRRWGFSHDLFPVNIGVGYNARDSQLSESLNFVEVCCVQVELF